MTADTLPSNKLWLYSKSKKNLMASRAVAGGTGVRAVVETLRLEAWNYITMTSLSFTRMPGIRDPGTKTKETNDC